ncbi:MAG: hypothetical protein ABIT71_09925 [Vicinamibacteraceae bacterium]
MGRWGRSLTILGGALTVLVAIGASDTSRAAPAAAPVLGTAGGAFTVDGRPRFLLLVSYFDALRAPDATLDADFAYLRRHGLDGVRIFPNWWRCAAERQCGGHPGDDTLFEAGTGRIRPERLERLRRVLDLAGRSGLVVDLSFSRETVLAGPTGAALPAAAYAEGVATTLRALGRGYPHVMVDLQNELDQNRVFAPGALEDAQAVARLARRVASGRRLVFASSNEAEIELAAYCGTKARCPAAARPFDVLAVHDAREADWHDRTPAVVRRLRTLAARRGDKPIYLQEPFAWQDERAPDRLERFLDAAARARRAGAAAWTFHTRSAFILRDGPPLTARLDSDQRALLERIRARVDASVAAKRRAPAK